MKKATFFAILALFCGTFVATTSVSLAADPNATLTDIGANPPTIGPNDLYCTNTIYNRVWAHGAGGINYYTDNPGGGTTPPGQTFSNHTTMIITCLAVRGAGLENGQSPATTTPALGPQQFEIRFFNITGPGGNNATLLSTYQSVTNFTQNKDGNWLLWTGLATTVAANSTNAYTFRRVSNGWQAMAVTSNTPPSWYKGGEICVIPLNGGGPTYNTIGAHLWDANFVLCLTNPTSPIAVVPQNTQSNSCYGGSLQTLIEYAAGATDMTFYWQTSTNPASVGWTTNFTELRSDTTSTNTDTPVLRAYAYTNFYRVWVSNSFGTALSPTNALTVFPASAPIEGPPGFAPSSACCFTGGTVTFSDFFKGTTPITYQWQCDGNSSTFTNIPDATNATVYVAGLINPDSAGFYRIIASNSVGKVTNSSPGILNMSDPLAPVNSSQIYAWAVMGYKPLAYWRLSGEQCVPSSTTYVESWDFTGNNFIANYTLGTANKGQPGPGNPGAPYVGFESGNTCAQINNDGVLNSLGLNTPPLNFSGAPIFSNATIVAWINPQGTNVTFEGIFMSRNGDDAAGLGLGGGTSASGMPELAYTWNTNDPATYNFHSQLYPPSNTWSMAAVTITPSNASIYLLYGIVGQSTNILKAVNPIAHIAPISALASNATTWIGADNFSTNRNFNGLIDEVAVFTNALSDADIEYLFVTKALLSVQCIMPSFAQQPVTATRLPTQPVHFIATAGGHMPITYQWQAGAPGGVTFTNISDGGPTHMRGVTNSDLTISNVSVSMDLRSIAHNSCGYATSSVASLIVVPVPTGLWTVNWCITNQVGYYGLYYGPGVLGTGLFWNPIPWTNALFLAATNSSASSWRDDHSVDSLIGVTVGSQGGTYSSAVDYTNLTVEFVSAYNEITFTNVPLGPYNMVIFGINGTYANANGQFVINSVTNNTTPVQDINWVLGDNCVLFTNLFVTNGTIVVSNYAGQFNGAQLQFTTVPVGVRQTTNNQVVVSWPTGPIGKGTLLEATLAQGPWTVAANQANPQTNTISGAHFYKLQVAP